MRSFAGRVTAAATPIAPRTTDAPMRGAAVATPRAPTIATAIVEHDADPDQEDELVLLAERPDREGLEPLGRRVDHGAAHGDDRGGPGPKTAESSSADAERHPAASTPTVAPTPRRIRTSSCSAPTPTCVSIQA